MSVKKKSKTKKRVIIAVIIIAVLGIAALWLMRPAREPYESVVAKNGDIETYYSFAGNVAAKSRQTIVSEKILQVDEINIKEGETVEEGDVLIKTTAGDRIKSKISGEVAEIYVEEGAQVMAGTKLIEIVDYDDLEVSIKVDEYDIKALEKGKDATVTIGSLDKEINGTIASISKEGQVTSGVTYFMATVDLEKDDALKIGMSAEVKLLNEKAEGVVTLPMTAIQFDDDNKPYVFKRGNRRSVIRVEITTGINDGITVEIKSGVSEGETVLYPKAEAEGMEIFRGPQSRRRR